MSGAARRVDIKVQPPSLPILSSFSSHLNAFGTDRFEHLQESCRNFLASIDSLEGRCVVFVMAH